MKYTHTHTFALYMVDVEKGKANWKGDVVHNNKINRLLLCAAYYM